MHWGVPAPRVPTTGKYPCRPNPAQVHASSPLELVVANAGVMALEQELTQGLSEVADVNLRGG